MILRDHVRDGLRELRPRWRRAASFGDADGPTFYPATVRSQRDKRDTYGVADWLEGCQALRERRQREADAWAREQRSVAMGFWAHLLLKHWHRTAVLGRVLRRTELRRGWLAWRHWIALTRRVLAVCVRFRHCLAAVAFETWRRYARIVDLRRILVRLRLSRAFKWWITSLDHLRALAKRLVHVLRKWQRRGSLGGAFWRWKRHALCVALLHRWLRCRLAASFAKWVDSLAAKATEVNWLRTLLLRRVWRQLKEPVCYRRNRRLGHCKCVYALARRGHCTCSADAHLNWRLRALRKTLDAALLGEFPSGPGPPPRRADKPPRTGVDRQARWDDRRRAKDALGKALHDDRTRAAFTNPKPTNDEAFILMHPPTVALLTSRRPRTHTSSRLHHSISHW